MLGLIIIMIMSVVLLVLMVVVILLSDELDKARKETNLYKNVAHREMNRRMKKLVNHRILHGHIPKENEYVINGLYEINIEE